MTFNAIDSWWWPYLFILIAGWLATDMWRYLGVYFGGRVSSDSEALVFVRAVATALVAAVIAKLIVFPTGALETAPLLLRIGAALAGFAAYLAAGKRVWAGVLGGETVLLAGMLVWG